MTGKTVTRADLCEAVYQKVGLSRTESAGLVEAVDDLGEVGAVCDHAGRQVGHDVVAETGELYGGV